MIFDPLFQRQLTSIAKPAPTQAVKRTPPANPRPPGHIDAGGATAQLLAVLAEQPQRFLSYRDIYTRLREPKSLNWSLRYCRHQGWVEVTEDQRNTMYRRYRITSIGMRLFRG